MKIIKIEPMLTDKIYILVTHNKQRYSFTISVNIDDDDMYDVVGRSFGKKAYVASFLLNDIMIESLGYNKTLLFLIKQLNDIKKGNL